MVPWASYSARVDYLNHGAGETPRRCLMRLTSSGFFPSPYRCFVSPGCLDYRGATYVLESRWWCVETCVVMPSEYG